MTWNIETKGAMFWNNKSCNPCWPTS